MCEEGEIRRKKEEKEEEEAKNNNEETNVCSESTWLISIREKRGDELKLANGFESYWK